MSRDFSTVSTVLDGLISERAGTNVVGPALNFKRLLWLRSPLMIAVAALVAIPGAIAAWFVVPANYTASADIRFLATMPRVIEDSRRDLGTPYDKFLNTQISLITGNTILSRVADDPAIRALPSVAAQPDALEFLKDLVKVSVQRNSEMATLTCSLPDRNAAKAILERVVKEYMDYALGAEASAGGERLSVLTKERDARQVELESQLRQITELQSSVGMPVSPENGALDTREGELYRENLIKAEEEASKAGSQLADVDAQLAQVKAIQEKNKKSPDALIYDMGIEERVSADARVSTLRQDLARQEASIAVTTQRQVADSPLRKEEEKRLETTKSSVTSLERTVRASAIGSMLAQYQQQRDGLAKASEEATDRVTKLRQQLDEYTQRAQKAADRLGEIAELQRKAASTRDLLDGVRKEITDINIESKAAARVQLASQATVPDGGPDYKIRLMCMMIVVCMSLGLGGGVGLLRELTDQHVREPEDLMRVTRLPVIATIPHASEDRETRGAEVAMIAADHPSSAMAEEYRRVMARVLYPEDCSVEIKTMAVAGPTCGDGRSSVACNVAISLADASRRVLLVDLNARTPRIEQIFKLQPSRGVTELLHGEASPEETIRMTAFEHLCILGPGMDAEDLSGRLASREMVRFMEWAEEEFDHVIMDTPATSMASDAKFLAPLVDGVLVVVGSSVSSLAMVRRCLREVELVGANVIGIVLNGVRSKRGGALRESAAKAQAFATGDRGNGKADLDIRDIEIVEDEEPGVVLLPFDDSGEHPRG